MKLEKLILVNWGALTTQEYPMGNMTLLTGPTGSGKSTMLDALQTVMTAVYQNIFSYNPGQDESSQSTRNGKTKRTLASYIVGAEDNLYARPSAHGYIAAVFQPSEGEEGKTFTALVAAAARVDGTGERRNAVTERMVLLIIDDVALRLDDLTSRELDGGMHVVAVEKIEHHLAARYRNVINFRDSKREYLCQLYGRFRGQKSVSFNEAESAAKAWSQSIAHRPIGSVNDLVKHQILELDTSDLNKRIGDISKLMRDVNALRKEGERLTDNVKRLDTLAKTVSATARAHELATQSQLLVSSLALRDDQRQLDVAMNVIKNVTSLIAEESIAADRLEDDSNAKGRSLTQIHAQMMGIPAADQKKRLLNDISDCNSKIRTIFNNLHGNALAAQQLENAARNVAGMQLPAEQTDIVRAARQVVLALSAVDALDIGEQLESIHSLAQMEEVDVLKALLLVRDFAGVDVALRTLHATLAGTENSFVAALHTQIAHLGESQTHAQRHEKDAASRKANLAEGGADYPHHIRHALKEFRAELGAARVQVLCDLIEPMSAEWQPAIEGYLGGARYNLVVDQDWETRAINFVRDRKLRAHVIQGSFCLKHLKTERTPTDSIVHELSAEHPVAHAFLHEQFGQVVKVNDTETLRDTPRGLTKDGKGSGSRTMFTIDMAATLVFGQEAKRLAKQRAELEHADAERELTQIRTQLRDFQGALALMGKLQCPSFVAIGDLERSVRDIDAARQDLSRLDLSQVSKLEDEAEALNIEIKALNDRKVACNKTIGGYENTLKSQQNLVTNVTAGMAAKQAKVDIDTAKLRDLCLINASLSLTAITDEISTWIDEKKYSAAQGSKQVEQQKLRSWQVYGDVRNALGEYHTHARIDERFEITHTDDARDGDFSPTYPLMVSLQSSVRKQLMRQQDIGLIKNLSQLRTAESSFNDVFTKQFCYEIRNAVDTGVRTLRTLNIELDKLKFGTDKFRIDWSEWIPEFKAYYDFFCATSEMSEIHDSSDLFGTTDLSPENCIVRDRLVQLLLSDDEDRAVKELQRVADYRNYRRYEIYKESDTGAQVRLSEWGTGSGGQLETPAYIIHAAVVTNRLKRFEKGASLRLLVNDESFAKMDEGRARDVLKFLRDHLGMQLICAMPTKHAGAIKPEFSREWSFSRTEAEGNGEVGFVSEADERELRSDKLRELWELRRTQVREQAQITFEAAERIA
ncbi:ATP-binding protein [Glaciimonas sp. PCH181]|uniref:ATP-binding protein n=1 Tax=Glaciimonas sp. PCH181 TaxID=2133943 RepID=UPI000D36E9BA|nr:SbcC/MukB-like Walker B domain-containing protein [Glaciimonas sp. PCH181]PUA17024.1 AAA family ATPase [Glaciimonas sp. PCH181]